MATMPRQIVPMLAEPAALPQRDQKYGFEFKWDGVRAIVFVDKARVRLQSRNLKNLTGQYPELAALGKSLQRQMVEKSLRQNRVVLDGEIVALDEKGVPQFELLQHRMGVTDPDEVREKMKSIPVALMLFDVLFLDGRSLLAVPYSERRRILDRLKLRGRFWQTPPMRIGGGKRMLAVSQRLGFEGVIAKHLDSTYQPGIRGSEWLKIKVINRQEFVIAGWTPGKGKREGTIGSLMLGYYDLRAAEARRNRRPQRLIYAGNVGTGFNERMLSDLENRFKKLKSTKNPFDPKKKLLHPIARHARFLRPRLIAEIDFYEWTHDGILRQPSFKGLRFDKSAQDVVRE